MTGPNLHVVPTEPSEVQKIWDSLTIDDEGCLEYLAGRGLADAVRLGLARFGRAGQRYGPGYRIWTPLFDKGGSIYSLQARNIGTPRDKNDRQRSLKGGYPPDGVALGKVRSDAKLRFVTEGIGDTLTMLCAGYDAIGAPGCEGVAKLANFLMPVPTDQTLVLCVQDEDGSRAGFAALRKKLGTRTRVILLLTPGEHGKDVNDWLHKGCKDDLGAFKAAVDAAIEKATPEETEKEEEPAPEAGGTTPEGWHHLDAAAAIIKAATAKPGVVIFQQAREIGGWVEGGEIAEQDAIDELTGAASRHRKKLTAAKIAEEIKRGLKYGRADGAKLGMLGALAKRVAYIGPEDCFYDTESRAIFTTVAMDRWWAREAEGLGLKGKITPILLRRVERVHGFGWRPPSKGKEPDLYYWEGKERRLINTWRPLPPIPEKARRPTIWLEHVKFLVPDDKAQRDHLLDILAYTIQHPDGKLNHALVLFSKTQGVGKDALLRPLAHHFGAGVAFKSVDPDELGGQFTYALDGVKCLLVGESHSQTRYDAKRLYNKLKPIIATDAASTLKIEKKGLAPYHIRNYVQVIVTTNYPDGVYMEDPKERRYFVVHCPEKVHPEKDSYYKRYFDYVGDKEAGSGVRDVIRWLYDRDLSKFNPGAPAPDTDARKSMHAATRDSLSQIVSELLPGIAEEWPVLSRREVADAIRKHIPEPNDKILEWAQKPHNLAQFFHEQGYQSAKANVTADDGEGRTQRFIYWKDPELSPAAALKAYRDLQTEHFAKRGTVK